MQYEKPELMEFDNYDAAIVEGSSGPAPCSGAPCIPIPGVSGKSGRSAAKPLLLDSNGNPVIVSDK